MSKDTLIFRKASSAETNPKRILVYSGGDPKREVNSVFYLNLFWDIITRGRGQGFEMIPIIDTRPENRLVLQPPEVVEHLEQGTIDGIIGIMLYDAMIDWMEESGIPYAAMSGVTGKNRLDFDYLGLIRDSFTRLSELGCQSVGFVIPSHLANSSLLEYMDDLALSLGLKVNYEWIMVSRLPMEVTGYNQFCSLWKLKERPDGLVIFPDVTVRGVVSAIVERRIRVPQDLKLVLHRNVEAPYVVPVPCDWIENSTEPMAEKLFNMLNMQWMGQDVPAQTVNFRLVKGEQK